MGGGHFDTQATEHTGLLLSQQFTRDAEDSPSRVGILWRQGTNLPLQNNVSHLNEARYLGDNTNEASDTATVPAQAVFVACIEPPFRKPPIC